MQCIKVYATLSQSETTTLSGQGLGFDTFGARCEFGVTAIGTSCRLWVIASSCNFWLFARSRNCSRFREVNRRANSGTGVAGPLLRCPEPLLVVAGKWVVTFRRVVPVF